MNTQTNLINKKEPQKNSWIDSRAIEKFDRHRQKDLDII